MRTWVCALGATLAGAAHGGGPSGSGWPRHTIDNTPLGADGVRVADLNNDGQPDFVTAWEYSGQIRLALNPGGCASTGVWQSATVGWVADCEDTFAVDLDQDGRQDLVTCAERAMKSVFVHWGPENDEDLLNSAGWRTERFLQIPSQFWMYGVSAQLDGEHGPDLVAGAKTDDIQTPAVIGMLLAPEDPRDLSAWTFRVIGVVGWVTTMEAEDMDGDGDTDIVVFDRFGPTRGVRWLRNPGPQDIHGSTLWEVVPIVTNISATIGTIADVDGDGLRDIVVPERPSGLHWFERLDHSGRKWERHSIFVPSNVGTSKSAAVGDINLDGHMDIVMTFAESVDGARGVVWFYNAGNPSMPFWSTYDISGPEGEKYDAAPLLDVDGDGDLDVVATDEHDNATGEGLGLIWYRNPAISFDLDLDNDGFVSFGDLSHLLDQFGSTGHGLTADFNHDGDVDFSDLNILLTYYGLPVEAVGCT